MIIEFSVKNFRSIKELQTLSFMATKLKSNKAKYPEIDNLNIVEDTGIPLLKTIGIYGANASGKSNIVRALEFFFKAISELPSPESRLNSLVDPFLYQESPNDTESFFQIILILEGKKYRYGFTVKRNLNIEKEDDSKEIVTNEWLYGPKESNQVKLFLRNDLDIDKDSMPNGSSIPDMQYKHQLFLTHAASFDKGICASIRNFINGYTANNYTKGVEYFRFHAIRYLSDEYGKRDFLEFLSEFNIHYDDISLEKDADATFSPYFPQNKIHITKYLYNDPKTKYELNLKDTESEGTKKLFDLSGLFMTAFNVPRGGGLIILDEIDSNFHPSLLIKLIRFFNNPEINRANSQLLFTSHDTNLLDPSIMRRDQFYFTEKDEKEATKLYALSSLKGIRNDADFARQYLAGFYGAIPTLDDHLDIKLSQ